MWIVTAKKAETEVDKHVAVDCSVRAGSTMILIGHDEWTVQNLTLGGIYTVERVIEDYGELCITVVEDISHYVYPVSLFRMREA